MNSSTSTPITCGPSTTPSSSSSTTTGSSTPRSAAIAEIVPAIADATTMARNVPGDKRGGGVHEIRMDVRARRGLSTRYCSA